MKKKLTKKTKKNNAQKAGHLIDQWNTLTQEEKTERLADAIAKVLAYSMTLDDRITRLEDDDVMGGCDRWL